ncbi:MAG: hypothetical protein KKD05_02855 [Candidatus Omnitrophica bacterium]|nr:hypothetical protein [Candidatus Omnitrophota bacterium]
MIGKNKQISAAIYKNQYENSTIRVTAEEYKNNLEYFITICRAEKIKLIFIVMPINLDLPDSISPDKGIILGDEYYQRAKEHENIKNYKQAEIFYKKALDYQVFICKKNGILFQNIMVQVAQENNIPVVNAQALFYNQQKINPVDFFNGSNDAIHPNPQGHMIIANALKECIVGNEFIAARQQNIESRYGD